MYIIRQGDMYYSLKEGDDGWFQLCWSNDINIAQRFETEQQAKTEMRFIGARGSVIDEQSLK